MEELSLIQRLRKIKEEHPIVWAMIHEADPEFREAVKEECNRTGEEFGSDEPALNGIPIKTKSWSWLQHQDLQTMVESIIDRHDCSNLPETEYITNDIPVCVSIHIVPEVVQLQSAHNFVYSFVYNSHSDELEWVETEEINDDNRDPC